MNQRTFDYSMTNIPIPSKKTLIDNVEFVIKRMRWKALLFDQEDNIREEKYGFKNRKCPPQHKDLIHFEEELLDMVKKIYF